MRDCRVPSASASSPLDPWRWIPAKEARPLRPDSDDVREFRALLPLRPLSGKIVTVALYSLGTISDMAPAAIPSKQLPIRAIQRLRHKNNSRSLVVGGLSAGASQYCAVESIMSLSLAVRRGLMFGRRLGGLWHVHVVDAKVLEDIRIS